MWIPYVQVDDVAGTLARARELGGATRVEPTQLPDGTWYCVLADPTGAPFALHGPSAHV